MENYLAMTEIVLCVTEDEGNTGVLGDFSTRGSDVQGGNTVSICVQRVLKENLPTPFEGTYMEERKGMRIQICELLAVRTGPGLAGILESASLCDMKECIFKSCNFGAQI